MADSNRLKKGILLRDARWSVVLAARDEASRMPRSRWRRFQNVWAVALQLRTSDGFSPNDAEDVTRPFFPVRLLERTICRPRRASLGRSERSSKWRLRGSFPRSGIARPHCNDWRRCARVLRFVGAESGYAEDPPNLPADEVFELRWAMTVLTTVMRHFARSFEPPGGKRIRRLKAALSAAKDGLRYAKWRQRFSLGRRVRGRCASVRKQVS